MRKIVWIAAVLMAVFPLFASAQNSDGYYSGSYSRLSYVKGDVYIQKAQDMGYEQGEVNLVVIEGDKIGTKDGRVEIQLGRRNYLRLGDYAQVDIVALPRQDGDRTKLHILSGSLYIRINTLDREKNFEIHTADASFYVLDKGLYRVDVRENKETVFSVHSGSAEAAGEEGSVLIGGREQVSASDGRLLTAAESLSARRDDLGDWNASRDALFSRRLTRTYLPAEYADYEYDLADNGRWVNESEYGNVWVPDVTYSDWRPYSSGRWSWYPIIGWTWVSYEPWGWCTSHYGRWGWGTSLGWYWIPQRHWGWGPAWVHWYWERDYIGWCPLSYYNYPGVLMNNRFYDRYTDRYYPNHSRALSVVHRDQLQDRRLSRVMLDQDRVGRLGQISLKSMQPDRRPAINRSDALAQKARSVLSRDGLRSVGKNFSSTGKRLSPQELRSANRSGVAGSGSGPVRKLSGDSLRGSDSSRTVRSSGSGSISRLPSRTDGSSSSQPERRTVTRDAVKPRAQGDAASRIRNFPPRNSSGDVSPRSGANREISPSRIRESGSPSPRSGESQNGRTVTGRALSPRSSDSSASRSPAPNRTIRERSSSGAGSTSSPARRSLQREGDSSLRSSSSPSRSITTPSRNSSAPSRRSSAPSRTYSAPSRSSSLPSRSSSTPARSYSAPSRSSSSPSRSYSTPSRSSSAPSRSYSSPSRSSSAPSRSYSAPSRSSSGSSASRGSGSSSSSSGGRVRKKN